MQDKYRDNFRGLNEQQLRHVATAVSVRQPEAMIPCETGAELFDWCHSSGLDHADVVMALAFDSSPMGVQCVEALLGKPIASWAEESKKSSKKKSKAKKSGGTTARKRDPRVVRTVQPNPKKAGSASHSRYEAWRVGETVEACMKNGLTSADVRHDTARGFVTLED